MDIEKRLSELPSLPGVYIMKGTGKEVLYIGKAKDIRARVRSYFRQTPGTRAQFFAGKVRDIACVITANEKEALILEDTLLKKEKPRYNIRLKDDKTFPCIKIPIKERFPRISLTRKRIKDGALYLGPYASLRMARETIKFLRKVFPLCTCSSAEFRNRTRPCLDYQLGLCPAPAVGFISETAYRELVMSAIMFLEGKNKELVKRLKTKMKEASARLDYELAARTRDQIKAIEATLEEQHVVTRDQTDRDVFALARDGTDLAFEVLSIRDGRLVSARDYIFKDTPLPDHELVSSFITRFYSDERYLPQEVIAPVCPEDRGLLGQWLTERKTKRVCVIAPKRGLRLRLVSMAKLNARESLKKKSDKEASRTLVLEGLKKRLSLKRLPITIEAFDISNISGSHAVGAMVVFKNGLALKAGYRLFNIRLAPSPDDCAMMNEMFLRRYAEKEGLPDLILVDGGKGQLNTALFALHGLGIKDVDVAGLAKGSPDKKGLSNPKGERVYLKNLKDPIVLKQGLAPDLFLREIRDEAHRFAVTAHRRLRGKTISSSLKGIRGLGPKRIKALFDRFKDMDSVLDAGAEELMQVSGITQDIVRAIKENAGKG
ncbi:MAG: excinuclease ABC subunit UvrC [Deltaproteobacteria bacterium]|nr:excinuclease ABC subunit UvrC [Deltaproteobacteria bacterium]